MLGLPEFGFETSEDVKAACLKGNDVAASLSNAIAEAKAGAAAAPGIQRIADVPIYFADPLVRRSAPLQKTPDAKAPKAAMNRKLMERLGLAAGGKVAVEQGGGTAVLEVALDDRLPDDCVRVPAAHASTAPLGAMFGTVTLAKVQVQQAA